VNGMTSVNRPVFARFYPRMSQAMDDGGIAGPRQALLAEPAGEVAEILYGRGCLEARPGGMT
jgi:hypothetical protein